MVDFILACGGLFTDTFNAALQLDVFSFLVSVMIIQIGFGLWFMMYHKERRG